MTFARMKYTNKMVFMNSVWFIISSITMYQSLLHLPTVAARDVLIPGHEVDSLVSARGIFTLGFVTRQLTSLTYVGIWYTNGDLVWLVNRNIPDFGNGDGVLLAIDDSGTVKVVNGSDTIFNIFYNQVGTGNNTRAVLEDSGNFVVYDDRDNKRTLWQSFDHLTDTLILGMKMGYNLTTKQNWTLTSRLSQWNLASGAFTMRLEQYQNSPQLLIYRREELYWASGPWNSNNRSFQFLGSHDIKYPLNLSLVFDASGMYLSATLMLQLSPLGQFIGREGLSISTPYFCYGSQSDDGCAVLALPYSCRAKKDSYQWVAGDWDSNSGPYCIDDNNSSISIGDCMERCWNDCNCTGFTTSNADRTGCITWFGGTSVNLGGESEKYVLASHKPPKKKAWIWILVSLGSVITSVLAYLCYMRIKRCIIKGKEKRKRDDFIHELTASDSFNYGDELEKDIKDAPDIKIFSFKAILTATDNFSDENKLGQGGYGPVYKGKLFDGREIAVKKLSKTSRQGMEQFKSELVLIFNLQHINLVRLYGCCIHREEKMLIYEFMPNKSLDFFLFDEDEKEKLDWQIRFKIIEGIAQGLLYLHEYSRMKVIHRDLKISNVLLDGNMNPKIADFGMARIFKHDVAQAVTKRVVGTYGYMAPEYAMEGTFSIKSDVYSFGVIILEIVSGKKISRFYNLDRPLNLVGYAWELWKGQASLELKDKALGESCDVKQLLRAIHVGLLCVQENANDRPNMSKVISMLNNEIEDFPIPKQPAFFTGRQVAEVHSSDYLLDQNVPVSENSLTVTTMVAR